jgi:tetratricopeptide (TPR) repeat protein
MIKKDIRSYTGFFTLVVFFSLLSSCSQTKNTLMHRGWHNMNARYNGYFYSRENIKETVKKVNKANKDDYTKMLPLFIYPDAQEAKTYYADFDKTIKKSSVVIQRHTIMEKKTKKEIPNACRWIDENYMLIGMAHFYKRDFFSALEAFEYVSKIYPRPESQYYAMLWMIRTNNEIGSYSSSEPIIDEIRNAKDFPKDRVFQRDLAALTADYYLKRGDYQPAIKHLVKAITLTKKKSVRARYIYVLAQTYEKLGDNKNAAQYYAKVPGLHPTYEMAFNAQINRAKLYDTESGDSKLIKKQLAKMLKDDKNNEFQDQIYYALAEIAYKEKDVPQALAYLDRSIATSVGNNTQKALTYLRRADIYFERMDYKRAQANYDSTMTFLPKDYVNYEQIDAKKKNLTSLVVNLNVISLEDSLQTLAKMSEQDRNAAIDKLIAKVEEEERKKQEEKENLDALNLNSQLNPTVNTTGPSTGAWYFYNPATVSFGVGEFSRKWGTRKLEDNWRRSEKEQGLITGTPDEELMADSVDEKGNPVAIKNSAPNKKDRNYYLKKIPLSQDELAKSNIKIVDAYYNVGSIYKEQLQNNPKAVETFEEMLKRYPENKYKLSAYYQLYRTYLAMNNKPKSDYYADILLKDYPDTEYARLIRNPGSAGDIAATKSQVEKFYTETYQLYSEGRYTEALANCLRADSLYAKSFLMPQFTFVKALSIGRTQDINAFEAALTQVVIKYPKEPVKERAQEMLDMIKKQKAGAVTADSIEAAKPKFVFSETGEYYWVLIVDNGKGDINALKANLSDLNAESFGLLDLHVSNVFLDATHQLVSVKTFNGKEKAMDYYEFMKGKKAAFEVLEPGTYQSFIISSENYTIFYKEKNIQEYEQFFSQNFK